MNFKPNEFIARYMKNDEVITKDEEIIVKINNILNKSRNLIYPYLLEDEKLEENKEYKKFLYNFKKMTIEVFNLTYESLNSILSKSFDDVKNILEEADSKLELGVFIPDREVVTIDNKRVVKYSEHVFKMEDIITFYNTFISQIKKHNVNVITKVNYNLVEADLTILLENISKNDPETIDMLMSDYKDWIKDIEIDKTLNQILIENEKILLPQIVSRLKECFYRIASKEDRDYDRFEVVANIRSKEFITKSKKSNNMSRLHGQVMIKTKE